MYIAILMHGHGAATMRSRSSPWIQPSRSRMAILLLKQHRGSAWWNATKGAGCQRHLLAHRVKPSAKPDSKILVNQMQMKDHGDCRDRSGLMSDCSDFPLYLAEKWNNCMLGPISFCRGLVLLGYQVVKGGLYVSEHPAPPRDESRPSIWTSPWMQLMRAHPEINLHIIPQWPFGATVPKPTGLLALRLPKFRSSLFKHADREACRPKEVAIGRNADGSFRTSKHKEYPPRFCAGFAQSFTDQLKALASMPPRPSPRRL